jgi:N-acetyl-gamma-glutamyl-phosphate reductase
VRVVPTPPSTKHTTGSNHVLVHVTLDERIGRIIAIGVEDNLVKGAAGQAVQAFNLVHGLSETAGLDQLPLAP